MTRPLPRRRLPSGNEARDWLNGAADLLEWVAESFQPETGRQTSLHHLPAHEADRVKDLLTDRIEQHNGLYQTYPSVRDCIQTVRASVGKPPGAILQAVRDALGGEPADTRTVRVATSLVEEARTAARILQRHANPTLAERATQLGGRDATAAPVPDVMKRGALGEDYVPANEIKKLYGRSGSWLSKHKSIAGICREATPEDKRRWANDRLLLMWNKRIVFEHTESAAEG